MANGRKTGGRKRGTPNKNTSLIRDMIANALDEVGGEEYLAEKAKSHPGAFLALIGKVMPIQVEGSDGGAVKHSLTVHFG